MRTKEKLKAHDGVLQNFGVQAELLRQKRSRIFVGSSTEAIYVAKAIQERLSGIYECIIWNEVTPRLGLSLLEFLLEEANRFDFAIFIYAADDIVSLRGTKYLAARDNVVFEHGLFLSTLGRERVYFITPRERNLHLPSDLSGVLRGNFETEPANKFQIDIDLFCQQVKKAIYNVETTGWIKESNRGELRECAKVVETEDEKLRWTPSYRVAYVPTKFNYREDRKRSKAYLKYYLTMTGENVRFEGHVRASGPVVNGWAYMIYEGVDRLSGQILMGVCILHVPVLGRAIGYWMTQDTLPGAYHRGIVFGTGFMDPRTKRRTNRTNHIGSQG